jgi:hypothetical protein
VTRSRPIADVLELQLFGRRGGANLSVVAVDADGSFCIYRQRLVI